MNKEKLYEDGVEECSRGYVICENVLIFGMIILGFLGMYPLKIISLPLVSILYVLFAVIMLFFMLRKHLCTNCYYYDKWCHCGWGKLSSAIFKKNTGDQKLGGKLAGLTWGILMGLPIIVMIAMIAINEVSLIDELVYLVPFIALVAINGILHKIDCEKCKMRFICPGSAAKKP